MKGPAPDPKRKKRGTGNRKLPAEKQQSLAVTEVVEGQIVIGTLPADPPAALPEMAHDIWRELVEDLSHVRGVKSIDRFSLEQLATMLAHARQMAADVQQYGVRVQDVDVDGQIVGTAPNKMMVAYRMHVIATLRLMEQFGLTPAARLRLGVQELEGLTMAQQLKRALDGED